MTAYLRYLPEFDNYGIEKSVLQNKQTVPEIRLAEEERKKLLVPIQPKAKINPPMEQNFTPLIKITSLPC